MKVKSKVLSMIGGAAAAAVIGLLTAPGAYADDGYSIDDLTPQQQQAIAAWESSESNKTQDLGQPQAGATSTAAAAAAAKSGTKTISLYRGSWVMWAKESVQFSYSTTSSKVNWSSGWQDSGWVVPNNVTEKGTTRYYASSTRHEWRGKYSVGAGVPTPWGNVNLYGETATARSTIKNIGSIQWWQD